MMSLEDPIVGVIPTIKEGGTIQSAINQAIKEACPRKSSIPIFLHQMLKNSLVVQTTSLGHSR